MLTLLTPSCSTPKTTNYGTAGNASLRQLLTPNDPNLPYPIYASFDEIEPLFNQRDGRTYVVNFWATWCRPCIKEIPLFEQLSAETNDKDLQVIMVNLDKVGDIRGKVKDFVNDRPLQLPVVAFTDNYFQGWLYRVDPSWTGAIPVTVFYRDGKRHFNKGQISSYAELEGLVRRVQ
ncbi:MAG: TlpA disulfide reductase family protein [Bacteroidota bacterium]